MLNKYKHFILYPLILILLLASACSQMEEPDNGTRNTGVTISMRIAPATNSAETRVVTPLPGEKEFDNVYMLIYEQNTEKPLLFRNITGTNQEEYTYNISSKQLALKDGSLYETYVIAGIPDGTTPPDKNTTKSDLMKLAAGKPISTADTPKLLFSGTTTFTYTYSEVDFNVEVLLHRVMARADITLANLALGRIAKVYMMDQAAVTPYWSGNAVTPNGYYSSSVADASGMYRFYLYENYTAQDSKKATLQVVTTAADGSDVIYYEPVVINNGSIERNNIYNVDITLK